MSDRVASIALQFSLAAFAFAGASPAMAQNKIKLSTVQSIGSVVTYIAQDKGYFKDEGLDVDIVLVNSAAQAVALLAQGDKVPGRGVTTSRSRRVAMDCAVRSGAAPSASALASRRSSRTRASGPGSVSSATR